LASLTLRDSVCRTWLVKKQLHFAKEVHAILFEKNEVSALPDLNKTLRGGIGEFAKDCLRARNRGRGIPLSNHN